MGKYRLLEDVKNSQETLALSERLPDVTNQQIVDHQNFLIMEDFYEELLAEKNLDPRVKTLAENFFDSRIDITSSRDMSFLKTKDPVTGEYKHFPIDPAPELSTEAAVDYFYHLSSLIKQGFPLYDFNQAAHTGSIYICQEKEGAMQSVKETTKPAYPEVVRPEVAKPGFFKSLLHTLFGAYKEDFRAYREYELKMNRYHQEYTEAAREEERRNTIRAEVRASGDVHHRERNAYVSVRLSIQAHRPLKEIMEEFHEKTQEISATMHLISGEGKALPKSNGPTYERFRDIPLVTHPDLPMEGLALLSCCSLKANLGVTDGSSSFNNQLQEPEGLTPQEQELLKDLNRKTLLTDIGGKVINTLFHGEDNRLNGRMEAAIKGRLALNEAVTAYSQGNKQPLADLINDSIEVLEASAMDTQKSLYGREGQSLAIMITSLDALFKQDPELRAKVTMSEERFSVIRGFGRIAQIASAQDEKFYNAYLKDKGPNTPEREELLGDLLFSHFVGQTFLQEAIPENDRTIGLVFTERNRFYSPEFLKKLSVCPKNDVEAAIMSAIKQDSYRFGPMVKGFGVDNVDIASFKKQFIEEVKTTKGYQELLNMDTDKLFRGKTYENALSGLTKEIGEIHKAKSEPVKDTGLEKKKSPASPKKEMENVK